MLGRTIYEDAYFQDCAGANPSFISLFYFTIMETFVEQCEQLHILASHQKREIRTQLQSLGPIADLLNLSWEVSVWEMLVFFLNFSQAWKPLHETQRVCSA